MSEGAPSPASHTFTQATSAGANVPDRAGAGRLLGGQAGRDQAQAGGASEEASRHLRGRGHDRTPGSMLAPLASPAHEQECAKRAVTHFLSRPPHTHTARPPTLSTSIRATFPSGVTQQLQMLSHHFLWFSALPGFSHLQLPNWRETALEVAMATPWRRPYTTVTSNNWYQYLVGTFGKEA